MSTLSQGNRFQLPENFFGLFFSGLLPAVQETKLCSHHSWSDNVDRMDDHDLDIYWPGHHGGHVIFSPRYIPCLDSLY
jgi:hypothetical protein